ncbi:protein ACCELERATED CELL DEATH 6-like [Macadamia integrifolia]|uniref:protein ACCELERATED CELL DEATH 6-like n=1 Tax=Macadamia integrifolia TaxID=60698 RepID=UPI001C533FB1|nr:protein ACCELERATED CELL DEATH 6-like [Macadamia integrifolia]
MLLYYDRSIGYIQDQDGQTPLHIAASGINIEIIKILVKYCPDSAYQVNRRGQNILHVVMRDCSDDYYSRQIFQYLVKKVELTGLLNQPDQDGNTPLHLATIAQHQHFLEILKKDHRVDQFVINKKKMTAQECCIGNEKKIVKLKKEDKQRNSAEYSPEDYAEGENERLMLAKEERQRKKEQLSQTHIIVAMLIATITFAAAIQMPGGYESDNSKKGMATLAKAAAFKAFVVSDSIALASSMLVVYLHFDETLRKSLGVSVPDYHEVTTYLMFISINGVMLAFMTGVYAVLMATESFWVGIVTIVVTSVVPVIASTTATLGYALGFIHRHISISKTLLAIVIIVVAFAPAFAVLGVLFIAFLICYFVSECLSHRFVTVSCQPCLSCIVPLSSVFVWAFEYIESLFV